MNGTDFSSGEIFRYWSSTSNSIEYRGETEFVATCPYAMYTITTRLILTFTGTGSTVLYATTIALNDPIRGDVNVLWHVQSSDFTIGVAIDALLPSGISNAGNWEPANDLFNRLQYLCPEQSQTGTSIDWGFYYQGPPILIFDDGFEDGNTNAWSLPCPDPSWTECFLEARLRAERYGDTVAPQSALPVHLHSTNANSRE